MRINVIGMNFLHTTWNKQNQGSNMHRINKYPCDTVSFTSKTDSRKEENNLVEETSVEEQEVEKMRAAGIPSEFFDSVVIVHDKIYNFTTLY